MFLERRRFSVTLGHGTARATHLRILTAGNFVGEVAMLRGHRTRQMVAEYTAAAARARAATRAMTKLRKRWPGPASG